MKLIIALLNFALIMSFNNAYSQPVNQQKLILSVVNFENDTGQAIANLFLKGESLKEKPTHQLISKIVDGKAVFEFDNLPYGDYAVIIFHDENSNNDLDHNWLGMPSEPLGYSNGWSFSLFSGMPTFEKLKFHFSQNNNSISIEVN